MPSSRPGSDVGFAPPRRSATAPVLPRRASTSSATAPAIAQDEEVETLYDHPSAKIIAFTANQRVSAGHDDAPMGTLPPSTRMERTIAVGQFRIYRAPGSVAFLSCGSALQPILPKSQCWSLEVDNSRFVLQIRRPQYWRIELPVEDEEDIERAELLGDVFDQILQFEQTECPFVRGFDVELPDRPSTPVKKKAWTAEGKNLVASPFAESSASPVSPMRIYQDRVTPSERRRTLSDMDLTPTRRRLPATEYEIPEHEEDSKSDLGSRVGKVVGDLEHRLVAKRAEENRPRSSGGRVWSRQPGMTADEDGETTSPPYYTPEEHSIDEVGLGSSSRQSKSASKGKKPASPDTPPRSAEKKHGPSAKKGDHEVSSFEGSGHVAPVNLNKKRMSRMLAGTRAYTAPPHLSVNTASSSKGKDKGKKVESPTRRRGKESKEVSSGNSSDSFHTVESSLPPSPPSSGGGSPTRQPFPPPHENIARQEGSQKGSSVATLTPVAMRFAPNPVTDDANSGSTSPAPADPVKQTLSVPNTETQSQVRHRLRRNNLSISRRALSPLPPAANLFVPNLPRSDDPYEMMRRLPGSIITKTLQVLLKPPAYLVMLMIKVAKKIMAGEWRGLVFGFNEGGEQIPVQWDYSDEEFSDWDDDEDDYGFSPKSSSSRPIPIKNSKKPVKHLNEDGHSKSWEVD